MPEIPGLEQRHERVSTNSPECPMRGDAEGVAEVTDVTTGEMAGEMAGVTTGVTEAAAACRQRPL